jgi:hypothetical protein
MALSGPGPANGTVTGIRRYSSSHHD